MTDWFWPKTPAQDDSSEEASLAELVALIEKVDAETPKDNFEGQRGNWEEEE